MAARDLAQPEWDEGKPTVSWAKAISDAALKLYQEDGRNLKHIRQARALFRGALARGADHRAICLVWYFMELGRRDAAGARACLEECRSRGGGCAGDADFWCRYAWFECQFGTCARTRAVAEAAVAACPRDPEVVATYACVELRMGCDRRARRVVGRARDVLADDEEAVKWIENDVEGYRRDLHDGRPTILDLFRCLLDHCGRGGSDY